MCDVGPMFNCMGECDVARKRDKGVNVGRGRVVGRGRRLYIRCGLVVGGGGVQDLF